MNTKFNLASVVVTVLLAVTACSPASHSSTVSDIAQPAMSDQSAALVAVTGGRVSVTVQDTQAYPSQQLHSDCVSENSHRQANCVDQTHSSLVSSNLAGHNTDVTYPSQQLHSACLSQDSQRQESCIP